MNPSRIQLRYGGSLGVLNARSRLALRVDLRRRRRGMARANGERLSLIFEENFNGFKD